MSESLEDQIVGAPDDPQLRLRHARSLAAEGNIPAAVQAAESAAQLNRNHHPWLIEVGSFLLEIDAVAEAVSIFALAAKLAPMSMEALNGYGRALTLNGQLDEALSAHAAALRQDPHDSLTQMLIANIAGNPRSALESGSGDISVTLYGTDE